MDINTETPSVEATPETEALSTQALDNASTQASNVPTVEEVFTPNLKYKAYGKEFEMDEWAKPLLNRDTQPHLTKLFEKAGGFEPLKERFQVTEQELGNYRNAYGELDGVRNQMLELVSKKDIGGLAKILGLSPDDFKQYVRQQLEYEVMSPEQKRQIDEQNHLKQQTVFFQRQIQEQQKVAQDLMLQKHEIEVMHTFNNPRFVSSIQNYNQRTGNDEAFRSVVDKIGAYEFTVNGRHMPVAEAVEQAIQLLGLNGVEVQNGPQAANPHASINSSSNRPQPKPIIVPNGSSSTPVKKAVSNWEDLKRAQKEALENY